MLFPSNDNLKNLYKKISDFLLILIVLFFVLFLIKFYIHLERQKNFSLHNYCGNNLRIIGNAMKLYAENNNGHYPKNLKQLSLEIPPDYKLKRILYCPGPGGETFTGRWKVKTTDKDKMELLKYSYQVSSDGEFFTIRCKSNYHYPLVPTGYPYFTQEGLVSIPRMDR